MTSVIKFREELGKNIVKGENPGGILPLLEAVGDIPDKLSYSQIQPISDGVWYSYSFGILYNVLYNVATWKCGNSVCSSKEANMNIILTKSSGKLTSSSYNLCLNVLDFAKHNTDNIWGTSILNYQGNSLRSNLDYKQITNASIDKFSSMCQSCNNDNFCLITLYLYMD